jgi:hypothetical protein
LVALFAPVSVAQDATTPAKKAPPSGKKAAMASEDPSKQPPSCLAPVNASKESQADYLIAENRRDNPLFHEEQPPSGSCGQRYYCSYHVTSCHVCSYQRCWNGGSPLPKVCWDTQYHRYCYSCNFFDRHNPDDVQSGTPSKP